MQHRHENSRLIHASFGSREMFSQWFTLAFGLYTFFFYESIIGLPSELALAAFLVFSVWNAINDPLVGYLMEKIRMPWQRRSQLHRFPWIVSYLVIFLVPLRWHPPDDTLKIFAWYVGSLLLFDTFFGSPRNHRAGVMGMHGRLLRDRAAGARTRRRRAGDSVRASGPC